MKVFENIQNFSARGSLEGWIRKIMVNTAIQKYRKNKYLSFVVNIDDNVEYPDGYYTDDILSQVGADELMGLIQKLPPAYKMVFNLYVLDGMKHKEIAALLEVTEGTSKSNLYEAKSILQKQINKNNGSAHAAGSEHGRKQRY